jgi:hypothetical protein
LDGDAGDFEVQAFLAQHPGCTPQKFLQLRQAFIVRQSDHELAMFPVGVPTVFFLPVAEKISRRGRVATEMIDQEKVNAMLDRISVRGGMLQLQRRKQKSHVLSQRCLVVVHGFFYLTTELDRKVVRRHWKAQA